MRKESGKERSIRQLLIVGGFVVVFLAMACDSGETERADYVPVAQLEQTYGRVITIANSPTAQQNGTGDLMGLFNDETGTIWGIPLAVGRDGTLLGCAPPRLRDVPVSGVIPGDALEIVGAANKPTGWRGGTGKLGLLLRDGQGGLRWHVVLSIELNDGPKCWSKSEPVQALEHYRLIKLADR